MKHRKIAAIGAVCFILIIAGFLFILPRYSRPLLSSRDTVDSILGAESDFRLFSWYASTRSEATNLVDMEELFALLSRTRIRRTRSSNWPGTYGADWVFWNMGGSDRFLRGRPIAFRGGEGYLRGKIGFGDQTFRLSNADEIIEFLERTVGVPPLTQNS